MDMIRVRLVGSAMVPNYEAMEEGILRFHGWTYNPALGATVTVFEKGKARKVSQGGFVRAEDPVDLELPFRAEYAQEVREHVFEPLDEETARLCGVPFKSV